MRWSPSILKAQKAIIRYLHANGLGPGDRLPPQSQLRTELGIGMNLITSAMEDLRRVGMLNRLPKVGTIISDPSIPVAAWDVGVLLNFTPGQTPSPFYTQITHLVLGRLFDTGCQSRIYRCSHPAQYESGYRIADYPGLKDDLKAGRVDGVIEFAYLQDRDYAALAKKDFAFCSAGSWEHIPHGVVIDGGPLGTDGFHHLRQQGCKFIALISSKVRPGYSGAWDAFRAAAGTDGCTSQLIETASFGTEDLGKGVANRLLTMPASKRPDGLLIADEFCCSNLCAVLRDSDYRPAIVCQTNRQIPISFALPVTRIEADLEEVAEAAVRLLLQKLVHPGSPNQVVRIASRQVSTP